MDSPLSKYSEAKFLWLGALLVTLVLAPLYWPLIRLDPELSRDDIAFLAVLRAVTDSRSYFQFLLEGRIFDFGPLRDLTFFLNFAGKGIPLLGNLHFFNVLVFAGTALLLLRIFLRLNFSREWSLALLLVFICHPAIVNTVSWICARKHLLAVFFLLVGTLETLRPNGPRRKVLLSAYICSLLCHPIGGLWPFWWLAFQVWHLRTPVQQALRRTAVFAVPMFTLLGLNYWYYTHAFVMGIPKYMAGAPLFDIRYTVSAMGRYFLQAILPLFVSPLEYARDSWKNPLGLALLVAVLSGARLRLSWKQIFLWTLPFFSMLAITSHSPTWMFVSDTYLLFPIAALLILGGIFLHKYKLPPWAPLPLSLIALTLLFTQSIPIARAWKSDLALTAFAYQREPGGNVRYSYAILLLMGGRLDEALKVASENLDTLQGRNLFAQIVLELPRLPLEEKIRILEKVPTPTLSYSYRLASLYALQKRYADAFSQLSPYIQKIGRRDDESTPGFDQHGIIGAEMIFFCRKANAANCSAIETQLRAQLATDSINERDYLERARTLERP